MARINSGGFELNSGGTGVEFDDTQSSPAISSSVVRSGGFSGRVVSLASSTVESFALKFASSNQNGPYYIRFYLRIATLPSGTNSIFVIRDSGGNNRYRIKLKTGGELALYNPADAQIGSNSSPLSLNTWYRIECYFDSTPASGSRIVEAKIDGTTFASSSTQTAAGQTNFRVGGNLNAEAQTTGEWFFDDLAVNDSSGSTQNTWPGVSSIIHLNPNAAGDQAGWGAYTNVDEVTPDDNTTKDSSNTLNQESLYNLQDSGLTSGDTINVVHVGVRFNGAGASANAGFKLEIEATSGGTIEQSAEITPTNTTWRTNAPATPFIYPLTLHDLPGASTTPWSNTTLDTAQIGYILATASTNAAQISKVWLLVDYTPGAAPPAVDYSKFFHFFPVLPSILLFMLLNLK